MDEDNDSEAAFNAADMRVSSDVELIAERDVLLDSNWGGAEHMRWVASAPKEELLAWAKRARSTWNKNRKSR